MLTLLHAPALHGGATHFALSDPESIIMRLRIAATEGEEEEKG
jgi:hypothetical protein